MFAILLFLTDCLHFRPTFGFLMECCCSFVVGNPLYQMLELQLVMFIEFPQRMHPGIFVAASDAFEFFNSEGNWSFTKPGFTALAHPSTIEIGTTHGVFVLAGEFYTNKVHVPIVSSHLMNIHLTAQQITKLKNHKNYCE